MSSYIYQPNFSYANYLQAKSFEDSIRIEINKQTEELISSRNRAKEEIIMQMGNIVDSIDLIGSDIVYKLTDINDSILDLNATLNWGFSEVLTYLGLVHESLGSLIKTAKTPGQTWAYEQFEIAREAYRKELYEESLEYLEKAINGYKSNDGYKIEPRFHFLKGNIHLGSFKNKSPKIINLRKSEECFLNAFRYSKSDYPDFAIKSLINAGWAAYCQGEMKRALEHTQKSIKIDSKIAAGFFQLAKIQMHLDDYNFGIKNLEKAIILDKMFAIKATNDRDIMKFSKNVFDLFKYLKNKREKEFKSLLSQIEPKISKLKSLYANEALQGKAKQVFHHYENINELKKENTMFGYLSAIDSLQIIYSIIDLAIKKREKVIEYNFYKEKNLREEKARKEKKLREEKARQKRYLRKQKYATFYGSFLGGIPGLVLGAVIGGIASGLCSIIILLPLSLLYIFVPSLGRTGNIIFEYAINLGLIGGGIFGLIAGAKLVIKFIKEKIKY